jgi:lipopolysaccharide export system protein LptA
MKKLLLLAALCSAAIGSALAERADSDKPIDVSARHVTDDDVQQLRTLTGDVVLVQGTLTLKAGKATVKTDPEGYQFLTFWAEPGSVATFRQKRDGGDLWVEGQAERIEYDNKTDVLKLFSKAKITRLEGKRQTDEAEGAFISYDSRKEFFSLENDASGSKVGGGTVRMVIQPIKKHSAASAPAGKQ